MYMTFDKRSTFTQMMTNIAKEHGCKIEFEYKSTDLNYMKIWIGIHPQNRKEFTIDWSSARSLSDMAVSIWARYFEHEHKLDEMIKYCARDVAVTNQLIKNMFSGPQIKDVIFHDPATIVFWKDGTKTVVKSQEGDIYDPEKGLAMAIAKKAMGNNYSYYNTFKHWLKKHNKENSDET